MYRAPVDEIIHSLRHVAGLQDLADSGLLPDLSDDLVEAVLTEAGRFAAEEITPQRVPGDKHGAHAKDGVVTMPPGWKELYGRWIEGGWNALAGPEEYGGQGLPTALSVAALEMWNSASMAFGLGPTLTMGAAEAVHAHGSDELKDRYLAKMVSGEWMGTMNLTEPHAGSDLGTLRTRAERHGDGTYRIFGQKIFITYGEHDLTDNIIHLVLARLPDAPPGTKGISLFLVPKFLLNDDGTPGARNDVYCHSVEHKLGIHASPTCTMLYGDGKFGDEPGAIGYLVGEENRGLACMFTMMNNARLAVGMQGIAIAEAAYQKALDYARERKQGRAPGDTGSGMSPIIMHPDVAGMLLRMKALTAASRNIAYCCAMAIDRSRLMQGDDAAFWAKRAGLLTPVAKSFSTDAGVDAASIGVQIHGGMGFIEETGAAMLLRDARIAPIYEGTNGIQAIDLVVRKLPVDGGAHVRGFIDELKAVAEQVKASNQPEFGTSAERLSAALDAFSEATDWLLARLASGDHQAALAGATAYQRMFGLVAGCALIAKGALSGDEGKRHLTRYMAEVMLGESLSLKETVVGGSDALAAASAILGAA